jgi:hypothetical protein
MPVFLRIPVLTTVVLLVACARAQTPPAPAAEAPASSANSAAPSDRPLVIVHKNATCGCCALWVEHMQRAGFAVETHDVDNLHAIKEEAGIPPGMGSCHTARIGGYFIEGHVPAEDVRRLLEQKPKARGLTVPGMPAGSPGMEMPDGRVQPYEVLLVAEDGTTSVFARHGGE